MIESLLYDQVFLFVFVASDDLTQIVSFAMGGEDAYTLNVLAKTIGNEIPLFVVKQGNNQDGADYLVTLLEEQEEDRENFEEKKVDNVSKPNKRAKKVKVDKDDKIESEKSKVMKKLENVGSTRRQVSLVEKKFHYYYCIYLPRITSSVLD